MAQDPERDDERPDNESVVDTSHDLDLVTLYFSQTIDSEVEGEVIKGVLDSNGIPAFLSGSRQYPTFGFEIKVPRNRADDARRLLAEQMAAGPEAAAEAEEAGEQ